MPKNAVLLRTDGSSVSAATLAGVARAAEGVVVALHEIRPRRDRPDLRPGILNNEIAIVAVDTLTSLGGDAQTGLVEAGRLVAAGATVLSVEEPWFASLGGVATSLGHWMEQQARQQRAVKVRDALRASGRLPGRPRRHIDPAVATGLVTHLPLEAAARELGVGASTLRRWVRERAQEEKFAALAASGPGRAA